MIRHLRAPLALATALIIMGGAPARADLVIDTTPSWDGSTGIGNFGQPNTATIGRTITTDAANTFLDSFTFYINTTSASPSLFAAYVMAWDGANQRATGPVLYDSGLITHSNTGGFDPITVDPGIQLQADTQYILFFSSSDYFDAEDDTADFGSMMTAAYPGGGIKFLNNGPDFALVSSSSWWAVGGVDLAFTAEFSSSAVAAPEPGSLALAASGALGLAIVARARRR